MIYVSQKRGRLWEAASVCIIKPNELCMETSVSLYNEMVNVDIVRRANHDKDREFQRCKSNLGSLIGWTQETGDSVVVEKRGHPVAVIVPYEKFQDLEQQQDRLRRHEARETLRKLREKLVERNRDLKPGDAEQIADEVVREAIDAMVASGKIRFEE